MYEIHTAGIHPCLYIILKSTFFLANSIVYSQTVLWIRIWLDRHRLGGSGSESAPRTYRSGAGFRSGCVSVSTKWKNKLLFFSESFNRLSKILKIITPMKLMRQIKYVNWHCCEEKPKNCLFSSMC
jgi:hypothetical protein